jgi:hypothetical protein
LGEVGHAWIVAGDGAAPSEDELLLKVHSTDSRANPTDSPGRSGSTLRSTFPWRNTLPGGHPDGEHGSPRPLRWLIIVVTVIVVLTVGWPVVSRAVSDDQPVAAGRPLSIGPAPAQSATFTPGRDWTVRSAETDPILHWSLSDGPVDVTVLWVMVISPSQVGRLWPGLQSGLLVGDASARLGRPASFTSADGSKGLTGTLTANDRAGEAAVFPGPARHFAIEIVSVAPVQDGAAARAAAALLARSLRFPAAAQ